MRQGGGEGQGGQDRQRHAGDREHHPGGRDRNRHGGNGREGGRDRERTAPTSPKRISPDDTATDPVS